jgi:hypothetical protein
MKLHPQTRSTIVFLGLSTSSLHMRVDLTCGCAFPTCRRVGRIPSSSHAFHCSHWSYVVVPISRYSLSAIGLRLPTLLTAIRCLAICRSYDGVFILELWFRYVLSSAHPSTPARGMLFPLPKQCPPLNSSKGVAVLGRVEGFFDGHASTLYYFDALSVLCGLILGSIQGKEDHFFFFFFFYAFGVKNIPIS